jgi:hypothetical protein
MKYSILLMVLWFVSACSSTVTGPVSGSKYNLNVGCTDDMQQYREEREKVVEKKKQEKIKVELDCPVAE